MYVSSQAGLNDLIQSKIISLLDEGWVKTTRGWNITKNLYAQLKLLLETV